MGASRRARYTFGVRAAPLLVLVLLAGCELAGPSADEWAGVGKRRTSDRDPGAIVVGRPADALSLDPARVTDNESAEVCEQIYDALLRYRPGTNIIESGLARTYEVSRDGREWTFHLREGVRFHDGTPLNADAVVFSFKRQLDDKHPYHIADSTGLSFAWANTYRNVIDIVALDPHTVRITIERRYAPFMANLAMFSVAIVSPTAVKRWKGEYYRHPVGTGPFRFVDWESGRIVVERNEDYWDSPAQTERLIFVSMPDARQRLVALESGAIDVAYSILPDEQQFVALHPGINLYRAPANNVAYVAIHTQKPPFNDIRVRRALNHAINKEPIVKLAYQGMAMQARGPLPPTQWGPPPKGQAL